jgi:hypothetical protein
MAEQNQVMSVESRLVPIMRGGVDVIKMIFFRKLKDHLSVTYKEKDANYISMLSGAVLNDLFGTPNEQEPFASFGVENKKEIQETLEGVSENFEEMRIPLTDALRIQFLCDSQEGHDSTETLSRAAELGILLKERDVPLPKNFLELVRRLGSAFGLITRPPEAE